MEISFMKCIFNSNYTKVILIKVMKAKMKYLVVLNILKVSHFQKA